ncbi:MAG: hypothetical protein EZS28_004782 [Streblomastix strix]|uniref:Uncharacterized protein n=1 Tax=Streblomastix strix TaxID=222440 RepID=A0A5J4WZD0_9EUKA|nr:MAG: hypothetical protein EZS28_004782 [Streblomastix strix]
MEKERQIEFERKQQTQSQKQSQPQQSQMEKDPEVNENQIERRSELKNIISLKRSVQNTQANPNIDLNIITFTIAFIGRNTSYIKSNFTRRSTRIQGKGTELKQPKFQPYAGQKDVIERFHEIMKLIIEQEKMKPKAMQPGQYKHYPNKDGPFFFYPPKNYRPTPIPRPKDLDLSEEQWKQFDGDVREG